MLEENAVVSRVPIGKLAGPRQERACGVEALLEDLYGNVYS